jgi:hypothetical protein
MDETEGRGKELVFAGVQRPNSDVESPPEETMRVIRDVQIRRAERGQILLVGEETKPMVLGELFDLLRPRHQIVNVERRDATVQSTHKDPGDLEHRLVDKIGRQSPLLPDLRAEPRLDDDHATRQCVATKGRNGLPQAIHGFDIADGAAETEDGIEASVEIEIDEISLMKGNVGQLLACHRQNPWIEVQPCDGVVAAQLPQVGARAAGDIEQRVPRCLLVSLDQGVHGVGRRGSIEARGVDCVVDGRRLREHDPVSA